MPSSLLPTTPSVPTEQPSPFMLPPLLDLTRADTLHSELQALVAQETDVKIDGSRVERVSTACVQLLVAARMMARAHGGTLALLAPSPVLSQAVQDLGLAAAMGMETA